jgi:hypothetical protein
LPSSSVAMDAPSPFANFVRTTAAEPVGCSARGIQQGAPIWPKPFNSGPFSPAFP